MKRHQRAVIRLSMIVAAFALMSCRGDVVGPPANAPAREGAGLTLAQGEVLFGAGFVRPNQ